MWPWPAGWSEYTPRPRLRESALRLFVVFGGDRVQERTFVGFEIGGMRGAMDLLQLADGDMRVDLSCFQVRMPEHRLDETDIRSAFEHQRGHRVTPQVAGAMLADVRRFHVATNDFGQVIE
jgi:hypothetical protein